MPIQLNYTDPDTGLAAGTSYWFAQLAQIDRIANTIQYVMNGYNSLASKNAGKAPFKSRTINATFAQLGLTGSSTLTQLGNALDTFALTYQDQNPISGNIVFFQGGTIV